MGFDANVVLTMQCGPRGQSRGGAILLWGFYELDFKMTTKLSKLALAFGALVMAGGAMAQSAKTASANAGAVVIAPLTITKSATAGDLNFGNVVAGNALGTVVLLPTGTRTATGGTSFSAGFPGNLSAAKFDLTGEGVYTYAITLPSSAVTLKDGATTPNMMTVTAFTVAAGTKGSVNSGGTVGTLAGGLGNIDVGATLNVGAAQVPGTYQGTFDVTVAYN